MDEEISQMAQQIEDLTIGHPEEIRQAAQLVIEEMNSEIERARRRWGEIGANAAINAWKTVLERTNSEAEMF